VHRDSVPAGTSQLQTGLSIPGFSYLNLPGQRSLEIIQKYATIRAVFTIRHGAWYSPMVED